MSDTLNGFRARCKAQLLFRRMALATKSAMPEGAVALVHDYLVDAGGAERILLSLAQFYPDALIYTSLFDPQNTDHDVPGERVRTSFLQRWYPGKRFYQALLLAFPIAFQRLKPHARVVLSDSSGFAKAVHISPGSVHVCYCYTPPRFAWRAGGYAEQQGWGPIRRWGLGLLAAPLRRWDRRIARRVDYFVAMSGNTARRIEEAYGRRPAIIPPPVETKSFFPAPSPPGERYFLTASRLVAYKRIDLAVLACSRLGLRLKVAGDGPDLPRLRRLAGPTVEFIGRVYHADLDRLYAGCVALLQPGEEDFGLTPLEANAAGRPAIAYGAGGACDTVRDRITGRLFYPQTADALTDVLQEFLHEQYDPDTLRAYALRYSEQVFHRRIAAFVDFASARPGRPESDDWLADWSRLDQALLAELRQEVARQVEAESARVPATSGPLPPAATKTTPADVPAASEPASYSGH
ncbi:MAG: glycosyltransferase [Chloroflexi bacterium]|nr:glycosyltransferase [Chloroflexota bacterium]